MNMDKDFLNAEEVAQLIGISKAKAYVVIRQLNTELKDKGYIVFAGRIPTGYLLKRVGLT